MGRLDGHAIRTFLFQSANIDSRMQNTPCFRKERYSARVYVSMFFCRDKLPRFAIPMEVQQSKELISS